MNYKNIKYQLKSILNTLTILTIAIASIHSQGASYSELSNETGSFQDETGTSVSFKTLSEQAFIVTMTYSNCKKTCPLVTLGQLEEIQTALQKQHLSNINVIIVSFDPKNDTPQVLRDFRKKRNITFSNWHFWTGPEKDTHKLADILGLGNYWEMDDHILHDYKILVFNKSGALAYTLDTKNDDLTKVIDAVK